MLVKFFKHGSGDGKSAFKYLLNHRVKDNTSRVSRGSADITLAIIQSLKTRKKYKSGCLSFEEENISTKHKEEIMDLFEETIFPGIEKENRNIVWIEHTDKNRLELNFVIPRVELSTFKAFNPYFHRVDKHRINAFRDFINTRYELSDPMEIKKSQTLKLNDMVKYSKNEQIKRLDSYLAKLIENHSIKNRKELIKELEFIGYVITRENKEFISIKTKGNKAIRLKGRYYKEDWEQAPKKKISTNGLYKKLQEQIERGSVYVHKKYYNRTFVPEYKTENHISKKRGHTPLL